MSENFNSDKKFFLEYLKQSVESLNGALNLEDLDFLESQDLENIYELRDSALDLVDRISREVAIDELLIKKGW